ncbi:MAG: hypothetical protein JO112_09275 [Planctomycetes bacterium]|nr:hypothetical protein [Planctomycetota bacterium]
MGRVEKEMMDAVWHLMDAGADSVTEEEILDAVVPREHPEYRFQAAYVYGVERLLRRNWLTPLRRDGQRRYRPTRPRSAADAG